MATRKKNVIDHDSRKSSGGYAKYKADNKARNAARPPQVTYTVVVDGKEKVVGPVRPVS